MASAKRALIIQAIVTSLAFAAAAYAESGGGNSIGYAAGAKIISYPLLIKAPQNTTFEFQIAVKNTIGMELDGLFIESESSWMQFDKGRFSMAPSETRVIPVTLLLPLDAKKEDHVLNISLNIPSSSKDTVSFLVTVLEAGGSASMSRIDEEFIRLSIEGVREQMRFLSGKGYRIKDAEDFAGKAEDSFRNGRIFEAIAYLEFSEDAIEKSMKKAAVIKTFSIIYLLVMLVAGPLAYAMYRKKAEQAKP